MKRDEIQVLKQRVERAVMIDKGLTMLENVLPEYARLCQSINPEREGVAIDLEMGEGGIYSVVSLSVRRGKFPGPSTVLEELIASLRQELEAL